MHAEERLPVIQKPKIKSRSSKRLLVFLFLFFITLLCVLFFQSSFSKVSSVEIQGQELLTAEAIGQASGVKAGDHFFSISSSQIEDRVKALKMVQSANVSKHFPGVIRIEVKEFPKVAYQFGENNQPQAILADGSVITVSNEVNFILDKPILSGWANNEAMKIKLCQVLQEVPLSYLTDISEIKPEPSESYPDKIKMYTRSQFEVITTVGYLPEKLKYLDSYIANLKENKINTGVLKLLEADTHAPFESDAKGASKDSNNKSNSGKGASSTENKTPAGNSTQDPKKDSSKDASKSSSVKDNKGSVKEIPRN
ncbi:cell division protein FtsQ/DivIB [Paenibacillus radicis (ex Xue et al. 2023)]|uniref:Cell division protein DivIB n=1 Tax=Paenibacillus radicis (ex Xue et al. 2023) TaxID=2972489 RepID=A0ABT1YP50_9BACL|nr:FtsQ-type POTRA domain-containing protein [Paenibacillus radicis (ex Xue et al. 2023)]MCR8634960.1 FtsQ-type POTRA domain-containing protein [Paenibacillus radicis (ex Xue et al. 2023)]